MNKEDVFKIFADAHKKIASEIYDNILDIYDIKLDKRELLWGSVLPDILPKYKLIRHYKDESLEFIVNEIMEIIYVYRKVDLKDEIDPFTLKTLSRRIGVVSHYLSDYVCLPHAKRWTFQENFLKHVKYEAKLNEIVETHEFEKNKILIEDIDYVDKDKNEIKENIEKHINEVVEVEYLKEEGFENDLDFALSLGLKISYFILDTIEAYSEVFESSFVLEI